MAEDPFACTGGCNSQGSFHLHELWLMVEVLCCSNPHAEVKNLQSEVDSQNASLVAFEGGYAAVDKIRQYCDEHC